ncbi:MAG: hypothetical protein IT266_08380 [Saprospiraceae bacterium]|nr:hypothetical protein [Saprospiraceae bacterium]
MTMRYFLMLPRLLSGREMCTVLWYTTGARRVYLNGKRVPRMGIFRCPRPADGMLRLTLLSGSLREQHCVRVPERRHAIHQLRQPAQGNIRLQRPARRPALKERLAPGPHFCGPPPTRRQTETNLRTFQFLRQWQNLKTTALQSPNPTNGFCGGAPAQTAGS